MFSKSISYFIFFSSVSMQLISFFFKSLIKCLIQPHQLLPLTLFCSSSTWSLFSGEFVTSSSNHLCVFSSPSTPAVCAQKLDRLFFCMCVL